jgi:BirA family transcriptional regulator, biotin operon repressor / biotin---[acetyl-CoA-carboxylase] ligase
MHKILANTIFLGKDIRFMTECHSTNGFAAELIQKGKAIEGTIVIAEKQTKGRGQRGNKWYSEPGKNLTFSLVLMPNFLDATEQFELNMAVSLGVHEAIGAYVKGTKIKWPNDFVHTDLGKVGGMLIENQVSNKGIDASIVGLGINVNQVSFPFPNASSLALVAGAPIDKEEFFKVMIKEIENYYLLLKKGQRKYIHSRYVDNLFRMDEWATFDDGQPFEGKIRGVTQEGKLMIEKP